MKPIQTHSNRQSAHNPSMSKRNAISKTLLAILALGLVALIVALSSIPDYREYKVDLGDGSTAFIRSSLNWKLQGNEDSPLLPVSRQIPDYVKLSLLRAKPKGVQALIEKLLGREPLGFSFKTQMVVSCIQTPVSSAESPSQIRDREQSSMQKIVNRYKGKGAFDTTLEKGQTGSNIFWTMMKDVVPRRFQGRQPNGSVSGTLTFTMYTLSPDMRRNLRIKEYFLYNQNNGAVIEAEVRKMANEMRVVPTVKLVENNVPPESR